MVKRNLGGVLEYGDANGGYLILIKKNSEMISFTFFAIFVSLFLRFPQGLAINGGEIQLIFVQHGFNGHWLGNRCVLLDQLPIGLFAKLLILPGGGWFEKWPWRHCLVPLQVGGHQGQAKQNTADGRGIGNPVKWEIFGTKRAPTCKVCIANWPERWAGP